METTLREISERLQAKDAYMKYRERTCGIEPQNEVFMFGTTVPKSEFDNVVGYIRCKKG